MTLTSKYSSLFNFISLHYFSRWILKQSSASQLIIIFFHLLYNVKKTFSASIVHNFQWKDATKFYTHSSVPKAQKIYIWKSRLGNARKYKFSQAFIEVQDIKYRLMDETARPLKESQWAKLLQNIFCK